MPVELVSETDLRAALRPYRADKSNFEVGILARIQADVELARDEDSEDQSPLLRVAAAFLPLPWVTGGKLAGGGAKLSSLTLAQKLLGYVALPSLFCLVGAAVFSFAKIRRIQKDNDPDIADAAKMWTALQEWWRLYKWVAGIVFAAVLILPMVGSTWLLFVLLLVSFGSVLCLLSSFVKLGVGNRLLIGRSCSIGLVFLAQALLNPFAGLSDIHFVDQKLIVAVLLSGALILVLLLMSSMSRFASAEARIKVEKRGRRWIVPLPGIAFAAMLLGFVFFNSRAGHDGRHFAIESEWLVLISILFVVAVVTPILMARFRQQAGQLNSGQQRIFACLFIACVLPMLAWLTNPIWWPTTPARIQHYVESFEQGHFPTIAWRDWEFVANWTLEAGLDVDLSNPHQRLADEIAGEQNPFVLGSAFRLGLVRADQIELLSGLETNRRSLLPERRLVQRITSLNQHAWAIHALHESAQLTPADRDFLEQRLLRTLDELAGETGDVLETALRVTQLLDLIDRPIDRDHYQARVHEWLREFHSKKTHFHQIAGGFEQYKNVSTSLQFTAHAIELMKIYGIPTDLEVNWVRSYLRPLCFRPSNRKWIAAVSLDRLNRLPDIALPTWLEILFYERSLITAMVLVALCVYATSSSPRLSSPNPDGDPAAR